MFLMDRDFKKSMTNMYSLADTKAFDMVISKCAVTGIAYFLRWEISMHQKRKSRVYSEQRVITLVVPCTSAREVYGHSGQNP